MGPSPQRAPLRVCRSSPLRSRLPFLPRLPLCLLRESLPDPLRAKTARVVVVVVVVVVTVVLATVTVTVVVITVVKAVVIVAVAAGKNPAAQTKR